MANYWVLHLYILTASVILTHGFSTSTIEIWVWILLCCRVDGVVLCIVCRMLSRIPNIPPPPWQSKMSLDTVKCLLAASSPLVENHCLNYTWELICLKKKKKDFYKTEVERMTFPKGSSKIAKEPNLANYRLKLCPWANLLNRSLKIIISKQNDFP